MSNKINNLKFLQINIKSVNSNLEEFKNFIIKEDIDISLLSETWLRDSEPKIKNFNFITKNRNDGYGGVALVVNKRIEFKCINIPQLKVIEIITIETINTKENFTIVSAYVPPATNKCSNQDVLRDLIILFKFLESRKNVIFGGDMNAHNPLWGKYDKICKRGKDLEDLYVNSKLMILNKNEITFIPPPPNNPSTIDLTFVSNDLYTKVNWEVLNENLGSDHLAIVWSIADQKQETFRKRKIKVDYKLFLSKIIMENPNTVNDLEDFIIMMKEAVDYSIIGNKSNYTKSNRIPKIWWTVDIEKQKTIKNESLSSYHKIARRSSSYNSVQEDERKLAFLHFKKQNAILKKMILKEKKSSWKKFVEAISPNTAPVVMWKQIKKLEGKNTGFNNAMREDYEKAKSFMEIYFTEEVNEDLNKYRSSNNITNKWTDDFKLEELVKTLTSKKNTSPGNDGISYEMLRLLPQDMKRKLLKIFNDVWDSNKIPDEWKEIDIVPVPKPGKDSNDPSNNRPIALIPVGIKTINDMIRRRLSNLAEEENLLPSKSFGFREGRSSINCINLLTSLIKEAWRNKEKVICVFLDISKAYDKVNLLELKKRLDKKNIPSKLTNWIINFFSNRKVCLETQKGPIKFTINTGIPQGSTLSPLVFNLYTAEIHNLDSDNIKIIQYADDFAIVGWNKNMNQLIEEIQITINNIASELNNLDLKVNSEKCAVLNFRKGFGTVEIKIKLNDSVIPFLYNYKYLGINLESTLSFSDHILKMSLACKKSLDVMRYLSNKKWGSHPDSLLKIYTAMIRSRIDYGSTIYGNSGKTILKKVDKIQSDALRTALGCLKSTPLNALLCEAGELPLELRRKWLATKEIIKMIDTNQPLKNKMDFPLEISKKAARDHTFLEMVKNSTKDFWKQKNYVVLEKMTVAKNLKVTCKILINNKVIKKTDYSEKDLLKITKDMIHSEYSGYSKYYTDGSKMTGGVGYAVYDKTNDVTLNGKVNNNFNIMSAELIAIFVAIKSAFNNDDKHIVIFTDSQSSCLSLINEKIVQGNHIAQNIHNLIKSEEDTHVIIQWIPSHINLAGNEKADLAAKQAVEKDTTELIKLNNDDLRILAKTYFENEWQKQYEDISVMKGNFHFKVVPKILKKPWFNGLNLEARDIRVLTRLRTNHGMCKYRKFIYRLEETNECDICDEIEDLDHLMMDCKKFEDERKKYDFIKKYKHLYELLSDMENYKRIAEFSDLINPDI